MALVLEDTLMVLRLVESMEKISNRIPWRGSLRPFDDQTSLSLSLYVYVAAHRCCAAGRRHASVRPERLDKLAGRNGRVHRARGPRRYVPVFDMGGQSQRPVS